MLPKFTEDHNRLLLDGAADSTRCRGACTNSSSKCHSIISVSELSATDSEETMVFNSPNLNHL